MMAASMRVNNSRNESVNVNVCFWLILLLACLFFNSLSLSHTHNTNRYFKKRKEMESPSTVIIVGGYRMSLESVGTISTGDIYHNISRSGGSL